MRDLRNYSKSEEIIIGRLEVNYDYNVEVNHNYNFKVNYNNVEVNNIFEYSNNYTINI